MTATELTELEAANAAVSLLQGQVDTLHKVREMDHSILYLSFQTTLYHLKNLEFDHAMNILSFNPFKIIPHRKMMLEMRKQQNTLYDFADKLCGHMLLTVRELWNLKQIRDSKLVSEEESNG